MDKYQDYIKKLAEIRDNKNLSEDQINAINLSIGLMHEKVRHTEKTTGFSEEDIQFVADNLKVGEWLAELLLEEQVINIYENINGTLANIEKVKGISTEVAKTLPHDGPGLETILREYILLKMSQHC